MDESLRDAALELVEEREDALVAGDRDAFLETVDPDELGFSATQARWFDNMAKLPLTDVSYELGDEGIMTQVTGAGDLQLPVDFTMRLEGFDAHPVTQQMVWTFSRDGDDALSPTTATCRSRRGPAGPRHRGTSSTSRCAGTAASSGSSTRTPSSTPTT
jgi:hypothetical protein